MNTNEKFHSVHLIYQQLNNTENQTTRFDYLLNSINTIFNELELYYKYGGGLVKV